MNEYPFDLGHHSMPVTTSAPHAQIWFDRALAWLYGFHHEEAERCLIEALKADPDCAMAHWAVAFLIGPNYNKTWQSFGPDELKITLDKARNSLAAAQACNKNAVEKALIEALTARYPEYSEDVDLEACADKYANEMRKVREKFSDHYDVISLSVEAMMCRTPWQMWDPVTGEVIDGADTLECRSVLEKAIDTIYENNQRHHVGIWHLYIHLMEMSPVPEAALKVADELRELVPSSGHLLHMSTHIDVLCGDYQNVVVWNHKGSIADEINWERDGALNFYSGYRMHNYHFKLYGAMLLGQFKPAMEAVRDLKRTLPDELIRLTDPVPMANWFEGFYSIETHALARFGKWQDLVDCPLPEDPDLYCMTAAMNHYGKGIAHAALKQHDKALEAQNNFEVSAAKLTDERMIHVVRCVDICGVARELMGGEIEYHNGSYDLAFTHLRNAVALEDALPYDEPWGWMMPSRHALGALLSEQKHYEEAAAAYEADLGITDECIRSNRHPNNVWALVGLRDCYKALGKHKEAAMIKPQLNFALSRADKEIYSSCFCSSKEPAA